MSIDVKVAGTDQVVTFPDGTSPEVIQAALAKFISDPAEQENTAARTQLLDDINSSLSTGEKFLVGAGRGLTTVARGLGLAEPEDPATAQAFGMLEDESTVAQVGNVVGEAAPFLIGAPVSGAGLVTSAGGRALLPAARTIGQKIAGGTALGAAEGNIITRGKDDASLPGTVTGGAIGGGFEAVAPVIGRLGRKLLASLGRQPKGPLLTAAGAPTPELAQALEETGTTFADLTEEAFATVNRTGVDAPQAARSARFASQDIPATAGDVSQDFGQQATEQRLISQAGAVAGEPLRQLKLQQSEAFENQVTGLIDSLGVPAETGVTLKGALTGRKKVLQAEKNALYKQVAETAPEIAAIPLLTDSIAEAMPDPRTLRRLSRRQGSQIEAVQDLLVEFGINKNTDDVARFVDAGGEIEPLSVGNFEDLRQELNALDRADQTGASAVAIGPIRTALDEEALLIDTHIQASGKADDSVVDLLKSARGTVATIKTEFSPQAITGRLIGTKADGRTPVIEASKAAQELLRPTASIENLERTVASLRQSGDAGKQAIGNLQASAILQALEASLKAPSRKTSGIQTVGGNQFAKALDALGDDKLRVLFGGQDAVLDRLKNLKQTALDITPTSGAVPKGSAAVILDLVSRTGSMPIMAAVRDLAKFVISAGADERAVRTAMNSNPAFKRAVSILEADAPSILSALAIPGLAQLQEGDE